LTATSANKSGTGNLETVRSKLRPCSADAVRSVCSNAGRLDGPV
jgi:hypothetical protein